MNIQYAAMYSLMAGHFANVTYSFDVLINQCDRSVKSRANTGISLDRRNSQTILHGLDEVYAIQTIPMLDTSNTVKQMREFLDSAMNGQYFNVDLYGSAAAPDNPFAVILESTDYSESRQSMHYLQFSFSVRKATGRQVNVAGVVGGAI
jgi:hypothetical protein